MNKIFLQSISAVLWSNIFVGLTIAQNETKKEPLERSTFVIVAQMKDQSKLPEEEVVSKAELIDKIAVRYKLQNVEVSPLDGDQLKITFPGTTRSSAELYWKQISTQASCVFRIVADARKHSAILDRARETTDAGLSSVTLKEDPNKTIGTWVVLAREIDSEGGSSGPFRFMPTKHNLLRAKETGTLIEIDESLLNKNDEDSRRRFTTWCDSNGFGEVEILVCAPERERHDVNDRFFERVTVGMDERGTPRIEFELKIEGGKRMFSLTSRNKPRDGVYKHLGVIVNNRIFSAPRINSPITRRGVIEGRFTFDEASSLSAVINAAKFNLPVRPEWVSFEKTPTDK